MNEMDLKRQITAIHIMIEDLQLYLNTHPTDKNALAQYNSFVKEYRRLKEEYNSCFGMISQEDSLSAYPWQWIKQPWPWEYEANFKL